MSLPKELNKIIKSKTYCRNFNFSIQRDATIPDLTHKIVVKAPIGYKTLIYFHNNANEKLFFSELYEKIVRNNSAFILSDEDIHNCFVKLNSEKLQLCDLKIIAGELLSLPLKMGCRFVIIDSLQKSIFRLEKYKALFEKYPDINFVVISRRNLIPHFKDLRSFVSIIFDFRANLYSHSNTTYSVKVT